MQIYIGNLSEMTTARHLANLFLPFGIVLFSRIIWDEKTGKSLGYGYIEMEMNSAKRAIKKLDRSLFMNSYMQIQEVQ